MTTPDSAESKFEQQMLTSVKVILSAVILSTVLYGAVSERWELFLVLAPFAIALMPGYMELLPHGGMRHGSSCECAQPDAACELGFWFEHGQKVILFLPLVLISIFLNCFLQHDLKQAAIETLLATLTAVGYSIICAGGFYLLVKKRQW
jgi:hypothetical protein